MKALILALMIGASALPGGPVTRLILAAAIVAALAVPASAEPAIPFRDMAKGAIEDFARPKFAALAASTTSLKAASAALCTSPSDAALGAARAAFKDVVVAFSTVEFVHIGPLNVDDRLERLLFWPDSKGIALKQVQDAIASKDPTATQPDTLQTKSVAMQGLTAVEYLLFGTGFDDLATSAGLDRCRYAAAASTLIDGIAQTVNAEWAADGPASAADSILNPTPTSLDYRTELEVGNKLGAVMTLGTDTIRDQRISPILSLSTGKPKPRSALFWRSGMTARAIEANFAGLRDFFEAARFGDAVPGQSAWISEGVEFEFENALQAAAEVPDSIDKAVADPGGLLGLKQMYVSTGSLDTLLGENLGAALGLASGFSNLDGD